MSSTRISIAVILIIFGILHITAGTLLQSALPAPPVELGRTVSYGD